MKEILDNFGNSYIVNVDDIDDLVKAVSLYNTELSKEIQKVLEKEREELEYYIRYSEKLEQEVDRFLFV